MKTKTKIAIVLFILQIIAIAGLLLGNSSGNYLAALGEAIGICAFTIAGIILVCLDSKQPKKEEHKIGFVEETSESFGKDENEELTDEELNKQEKIILLVKLIAIFVVIAILTITAICVTL